MQPYNLDEIPFSMAGSFLTISSLSTSSGSRLAYRTCSSKAISRKDLPYSANDFFEIALSRDGSEVPYQWTARPDRLDLITAGDGSATFVFADPETILFRTRGVGLQLLPAKPFASAWQPDKHQLHLIDYPARGIHQLRAGQGTQLTFQIEPTVFGLAQHHHDLPRKVNFMGEDGAEGALRFSRHETLWKNPLGDFDECLTDREQDYGRWAERLARVPSAYQETAEQAWFLIWNCQVPAEGVLTRPAIYMSKFWMNSIWAWDNCFNALAVARADPDLAWQQLLLFFDHQNPQGMVPDMLNDLEAIYAFTKPPIHGWTIRKLVEILGPKRCLPYLTQIYRPLSKLVEWWYTLRDFDADGMPQYHHGNDSGWDNATVFDQGFPTEGADLAAFLVLQCETLAYIAQMLGKEKSATRWQDKAKHQLHFLLKKGVTAGRFFAPLDGASDAPEAHSLLNYLPILLGKRLPETPHHRPVRRPGPRRPISDGLGLCFRITPQSKVRAGWILARPDLGPFDLPDSGWPDRCRKVGTRPHGGRTVLRPVRRTPGFLGEL